MTQTLYFSVLLITLCSLSECIQRRYHHINMMMNWTEAQKYCRENYADLATVNNINDMKQLIESNVLIGLYRSSVYKWKWSLGDPVKYTNWYNGDSNGSGQCVYMRNGSWYHQDCNMKIRFICYNDNLILIQMNLSWSEALRYCRENHVDLVSVDSEKIQFMVTDVINESSTDAVWMGLRHSCAVGLWFWVNGEMVCYQNWAPGNETAVDDCDREVKSGAVQSGDHCWISLPQSYKLNFICIRK
ncbi:macrophage mannose receptor 1-like isoform X2 [Misgurnus anguillicaudatus]|uniref:macrophage mannose receptor 1-like isoform X2 n=1 Tax=Misgurnus anguillicaudatus TaxID=75329 RepID=UPI003CCF9A12